MVTYQKKILDVGKNKTSSIKPIFAGIEITNKCNLNCVHCYNDKYDKKHLIDINPDDFRLILSRLQTLGVFSVSISGGEPLCHNNFEDICKLLKEKKFVAELVTNGSLLDNYSEIINNTFHKIYISIDGPENIHNKIRDRNCFRQIIKNLSLIKIRKIMCATISRLNKQYLEKIIRLAIKLKFDSLCIFIFKPVGRSAENKALLALDNDSLLKIDAQIDKLKRRFPIKITYVNPLTNKCYAGQTLIHILPNGKVKPCAYSKYEIGNILSKKWKMPLLKINLKPSRCHAF